MNKNNTALVLVGFQNDYFHPKGILAGVVEDTMKEMHVLENTLTVIDSSGSELTKIITPIVFSKDYNEIVENVGILKAIKDLNAFQEGSFGAETIKEFKERESQIVKIPGKHGLNAFIDTDLETVLREKNITTVVLAGCVCSICIDSTGRSAFDKGFEVIMLSDCITGRSLFEHKFYCDEIFPLYSKVMDSKEFLKSLNE